MPSEVPNRDEWFPQPDAFPRPDWPAIRGWKRAWVENINREIRPPAEIFRRFVKQSTWHDAGEAAAREQFEVSLGEIASVFPGDGDWAPKPATWKQR